jgi:hypothetical protein
MIRPGFAEAGADLEQTAGIGRNDDGRAGLEDVLNFAALKALSHFRLR